MKMAKNIPIDLNGIDFSPKFDTGFRLILDYYAPTDGIILRIDAKIENRQYCVVLASSYPILTKEGQRISPNDDLITPNKAIEACLNLKVNKKQLIEALGELVLDLENDGKE